MVLCCIIGNVGATVLGKFGHILGEYSQDLWASAGFFLTIGGVSLQCIQYSIYFE